MDCTTGELEPVLTTLPQDLTTTTASNERRTHISYNARGLRSATALVPKFVEVRFLSSIKLLILGPDYRLANNMKIGTVMKYRKKLHPLLLKNPDRDPNK